jgi:hypothetical protein
VDWKSAVDRHLDEIRIADMEIPVGNREPHHYTDQVEVGCRIPPERLQIEIFEQVQLFEHGDGAAAASGLSTPRTDARDERPPQERVPQGAII